MIRAVFVAPYLLEETLRFVRAAAEHPGVRLAVVSSDPAARLPADLLRSGVLHQPCPDAMRAEPLAAAVRQAGKAIGGSIERLLGILEPLQEVLAEVRESLGIRGMGVEEARNFRDKSRMKDRLREAGIPCARHALAASLPEARAFAADCGFPLIVKPPAGAGARQTFRVEDLDQLEGCLRTMMPRPGAPVLLEEFITGREHSFDSVTIGGRHVFHSISRYLPSPLEVLRESWIQWCVVLPRSIDGPEYEDIRVQGPHALDVLGMVTGMSHMEWFRREGGGLAISEVAARPPGARFPSLLAAAHDRDFHRAWAEVMLEERFPPPERRFAAGAVYLRGMGEGRVRAVLGWEAARRELGTMIFDARLPRPGQAPAGTYEGEGVVILRHPRTEEVERGCAWLLRRLRVELG